MLSSKAYSFSVTELQPVLNINPSMEPIIIGECSGKLN
jgi:hypothetical protein